MKFVDRKSAGQLMYNQLLKTISKDFDFSNCVVLALLKGGVPLAFEISKGLKRPLDIIIIKKFGSPLNQEIAIGAVSENNEVLYNIQLIESLKLEIEEIDVEKNKAFETLNRLSVIMRGDKKPLDLKNKDIIVVDDGISTGATFEVAIQFLKNKEVRKIVCISPVSSLDGFKKIELLVDQLIVFQVPSSFTSVKNYYENFKQVQVSEVLNMLLQHPVDILIKVNNVTLNGSVFQNKKINGKSWIVFAQGSESLQNNMIAQSLFESGHNILLFDLLSDVEEMNYNNRFNIPLLSSRLIFVTKWLKDSGFYTENVPVGYFGFSTGSAAALLTASNTFINDSIFAIVSIGGRPDMVDKSILLAIRIPVLLIVGSKDNEVLKLNKKAALSLSKSQLILIPNATHLFEKEGALVEATKHSLNWIEDHLVEYNKHGTLQYHIDDEFNYLGI